MLPNAVSIIHVDKNIIRIESLNDGTSKNEMKTENIENKNSFFVHLRLYLHCDISKIMRIF